MNAEKHNLDRIYFGGGFIRGSSCSFPFLPHLSRLSSLFFPIPTPLSDYPY